MDLVESYLNNFDLVKESIRNVYGYVCKKISSRRVFIPVSSILCFYFIFVRKSGRGKKKFIVKEPCKPDEEYTGEDHPYIELELTILDHWLSIAISRMLMRTFVGSFMVKKLRKKAGLHLPIGQMTEPPTFYPFLPADQELLSKQQIAHTELWSLVTKREHDEFHFNTIADYIIMYRKGEVTPLDVAKNIIAAFKATENHTPDLKAIIEYNEDDILKLAKESSERWRSGNMLSIFDGIPVAIKDEFFVGGYHLRNGLPVATNDQICTIEQEAGLVKKLRTGGALFIGIANMHQIGIGTLGINPSKHHGTTRNPYNPNHSASGSSGGSGSAVAAGYCPVALGTDGGGSIRLPAAVNGVVGMKATYGRYAVNGMMCNAMTVGHTGPLCATVRDTAISYGYLAGKDEGDMQSQHQPPVFLGDFENTDLTGMRIGVDPEFLRGTDPELQAGLLKAIEWVKTKHNATIVEIRIPEKMETGRALTKTFTSEVALTNDALYSNHYDELNIDVIGSLRFGRSVSANEYLTSARQRTRSINALKFIFTKVDAIITPAFGVYQPVVTPSREKYGYSNLNLVVEQAWIAMMANLTGVPAISLPVDYSPTNNLPIPVQVMAPWWREDTLLRVAFAIESNVTTKRPEVFYDVLE